VAVALVGTAPAVAAQSCTTNSSIRAGSAARSCIITDNVPNASSYTNPALLQLTASAVNLGLTVNEAAFNTGRTGEVPLTLQIVGNRSWVLTASGPAAWTASGPLAWMSKPVGDLRWSMIAGGDGTALSTSAATLAAGEATAAFSVTVHWTAALAWERDKPGTYSLPVTLTLTAP
jgi:hypothetical protein